MTCKDVEKIPTGIFPLIMDYVVDTRLLVSGFLVFSPAVFESVRLCPINVCSSCFNLERFGAPNILFLLKFFQHGQNNAFN